MMNVPSIDVLFKEKMWDEKNVYVEAHLKVLGVFNLKKNVLDFIFFPFHASEFRKYLSVCSNYCNERRNVAQKELRLLDMGNSPWKRFRNNKEKTCKKFPF